MFRVKQSGQLEAHESGCKPCPVTASSPVCGSDGHNYASEVRRNHSAPASRFEGTCEDNSSFALLLDSAAVKTLKEEMESARVIVFK